MHIRRFIRYIRNYSSRKDIDWTLKKGDLVASHDLPYVIEIIDINWALWAAAVRLDNNPDAIIVLPLWSLYRYEL